MRQGDKPGPVHIPVPVFESRKDTKLTVHVDSEIRVSGDTFNHKDLLKSQRGSWESATKTWKIEATKQELCSALDSAGVRYVLDEHDPVEEVYTSMVDGDCPFP